MAHCILQAKDLPTCFGGEVVYCANYLLNRTPTWVVIFVTPIDICCGKNPSFIHLGLFRYISWAHIPDDCRKKLDAKSHPCISMGYSKESKAYWLFDHVKRQIIIRRNVFFMRSILTLSFWMLPLVYYNMVPLILFLTMDHMLLSLSFQPDSWILFLIQLHSWFLGRLALGLFQLKLLLLLIELLKCIIVQCSLVFLSGMLKWMKLLVYLQAIRCRVRSRRPMLPWWLVFLRFVIMFPM